MLQKLQSRKVVESDRDEIQRLHAQYPYYYHLPTDIAEEVVIIVGNRIVGYGALEILCEPVAIIDQTLSLRDKAVILKQLFSIAIRAARYHGIHDFFVFSINSLFSAILCKHFKFQDHKGDVLIRHVSEEI